MNPQMNGQSPAEQLAQLAAELQDAHLVIGQQQVQMLRQQQALQQMQQRIMELEAQAENSEVEVEVS